MNKLTRNRIIPTTKTILAAPAAVPARPPNPSAAAINAITRNMMPQRNISVSFTIVKVHVNIVEPRQTTSFKFKPFKFNRLQRHRWTSKMT